MRSLQAELESKNDELRQLQSQLLSIKGRYTDLYDLAPVGYCTISEQGLILRANLRAASLLGVDRKSLIKRPFSRYVFKQDADICYLFYKQLIKNREPLSRELRMVGHDGTIIWMQLTATVARDVEDSSAAPVLLIVMTEINEQKRAQDALSQSEEKYRSLLNNLSSGVVVHNADTSIRLSNPAAASLLGLTEDQLRGKTAMDPSWCFLEESGAPMPLKNYPVNRVIASGVALKSQPVGVCRPDRQTPVWVLCNAYPVLDERGKLLQVVVTFTDISELKQVESGLRESEERWKFAIEGSGDGVWDWNIATGDAIYSTRWKEMLGFADSEIENKADEWSKRVHPDDMPQVMEKIQAHIDGKTASAVVEHRMQSKDGSWRWILGRGMVVSRDASGKPLRLIGTNTDISESKEHEGQLQHLAHFDVLTGLPNRVLLGDRLQQAMLRAQRQGQRVAVAYLDLDGFKAVNDDDGHDVGDQLLIIVATRMKESLREGDTLARLGGDEFVAVLLDLPTIDASVPLLIRLLDAASLPVHVGNLVLQVSASIGVAFYPQADADVDADHLLRQADQAMYQAKLAGKNRYCFFDSEQDISIRTRHESLAQVRRALAMGEFVLHYQPKVNMRAGTVVGVEALIRWQCPERGLLPPAEFLPLIEEHPLAIDIGEWVIETALAQIGRWHALGLNIPVSVNIGARQLQQLNFVERLQAILARHPDTPASSLELEVLETSALEDLNHVSHVIETCRAMGICFSLDDFGTGYSSLTYLKRLPVALLKIDQTFVRDMLDDPDDLSILEGVLSLATAFKRLVIAEGVETQAHGAMLLQLGCELGQGFGIARPMPGEAIPEWLATWGNDPSWNT